MSDNGEPERKYRSNLGDFLLRQFCIEFELTFPKLVSAGQEGDERPVVWQAVGLPTAEKSGQSAGDSAPDLDWKTETFGNKKVAEARSSFNTRSAGTFEWHAHSFLTSAAANKEDAVKHSSFVMVRCQLTSDEATFQRSEHGEAFEYVTAAKDFPPAAKPFIPDKSVTLGIFLPLPMRGRTEVHHATAGMALVCLRTAADALTVAPWMLRMRRAAALLLREWSKPVAAWTPRSSDIGSDDCEKFEVALWRLLMGMTKQCEAAPFGSPGSAHDWQSSKAGEGILTLASQAKSWAAQLKQTVENFAPSADKQTQFWNVAKHSIETCELQNCQNGKVSGHADWANCLGEGRKRLVATGRCVRAELGNYVDLAWGINQHNFNHCTASSCNCWLIPPCDIGLRFFGPLATFVRRFAAKLAENGTNLTVILEFQKLPCNSDSRNKCQVFNQAKDDPYGKLIRCPGERVASMGTIRLLLTAESQGQWNALDLAAHTTTQMQQFEDDFWSRRLTYWQKTPAGDQREPWNCGRLATDGLRVVHAASTFGPFLHGNVTLEADFLHDARSADIDFLAVPENFPRKCATIRPAIWPAGAGLEIAWTFVAAPT